jgi:hypothetical protein
MMAGLIVALWSEEVPRRLNTVTLCTLEDVPFGISVIGPSQEMNYILGSARP